MPLTGEYQPSTSERTRRQVELFERSNGVEGNTLRGMPVIVLTTTDSPKDIDRCYALGCNVFMNKPVGYDAFSEAIQKLGLMMTIVRIPHIND